MKTRWLSLLLCLVMLLSVALTGCSKKDNQEAPGDEASQSALTLTMWVVAEEKPSADAYARISDALNSITKSKFKVQLVLRYFTEDEYRAELEKTIAAFEASKQNAGASGGVTAPEEEESVSDEYVTNDAGLSVIKYPELLQNQVDIIYISGEDMYVDFVNKGWLADLKAELASTAKKIKEYVSPTLLSAVQTASGQTYAIPNNRPIGEYNYMLINKELMKTYAQDAYVKTDMIDGLFCENLYPFLNLVHMMDENDEIIPIDATYEDCLNLLAYYWNISSDDYKVSALKQFSVFGHYYENIEDLSRGSVLLGYKSLFENEDFVEDYLKLNEFRFKDYLRRENETRTKAAVKFMNGDATVMSVKDADGVICYTDENGEEYYPIVVGYPTATTEDIYGNMFGVCTYARHVSRSMEIITYLNTNPDFRNILQYGVEGIDYEIIKDDEGNFLQVHSLGTGYNMDIWATGNTFIAHPDTEAGLDIHVWENGKVQNRDSLVDPLLGFDFKSATAEEELGVTIASAGYNSSLTTGVSKDLLSQNAMLAKWLTDCDAAGKGIYVLQSQKAEGTYTTFQYYFYNNNVSGKVKPTLNATPITELNSKGKEVTVGMDFALNYEAASGASDTPGYELTSLTLQVKKSLVDRASMKVTNADVDAEASFTDAAETVVFDFYNTANYSIEVYADLTKAEVRKNLTLMNWLQSKAVTGNDKSSGTHMLKYKDGNDYVFVVYRNGIKCLNVMTMSPKGDSNNLILDMNIEESEDLPLASGKPSYVMYLIRVKTTSDAVNVDCVQTLNGQRTPFKSEPTLDVKIDYERLGQMDTELIKFAERLNAGVIAQLDACYAKSMAAINAASDKDAAIAQAIADYTALVNDLSKLLTVTDVESLPAYTAENYPVLSGSFDLLSAVKVDSFNTFLKYMKDATSFEIIEEPKNPQTGADAVLSTSDGNEAYVYFTSPFGIYYQWLKSSKFLPAEE